MTDETDAGQSDQEAKVAFKKAELSARIRRVVELFPSRRAAAKLCGRTEDMLLRYEKGTTDAPFIVLAQLAVAANVRIDWLATGKGAMMASGPDPSAEDRHMTQIPIFHLAVSAGPGEPVFADSNVHAYMGMPTDYVREFMKMTPGAVVILRVRGDSMSPTMEDNDLVFLDTSVHAVDQPGIYVLRRENDLFVKRVLRRADGSVVLKADNPRYPEDQLAPDKLGELQVLGRVGSVLGKGG